MKKLLGLFILSCLFTGYLHAQGSWTYFNKDSMNVKIEPVLDTIANARYRFVGNTMSFDKGSINPIFSFKYEYYKQFFLEDKNNNIFYFNDNCFHSLSEKSISLDTTANLEILNDFEKTNEGNKILLIKRALQYDGGPKNIEETYAHIDSKQNIWSYHQNGLYLFDKNGWQLFDESSGLPIKDIRGIYENKNKNSGIWITTKIDKYERKFKLYQYIEEGNKWLLHDNNTGYEGKGCSPPKFDSKGNVWVTLIKDHGPNRGFAKYDGENWAYYLKEEGIPASPCGLFLIDKNDELWFTTCNNNLKTKGIIHYNNKEWVTFDDKDLLKKIIVRIIDQDSEGNVWFHGENGIIIYDGNEMKKLYGEINTGGHHIQEFFEDSNGNTWIISPTSIAIYRNDSIIDLTKKLDYKIQTYSAFIENYTVASSILDIHEDSNGSIWILRCDFLDELLDYDVVKVANTLYNGDILRLKDGNWKRFKLPDRKGLSLFEDSQGDIWIDAVDYIYKYSYQ